MVVEMKTVVLFVFVIYITKTSFGVQADVNNYILVSKQVVENIIPEKHEMIETIQALKIAFKHVGGEIEPSGISDIIVDPVDANYVVNLVELASKDKPLVNSFEIIVNAGNGEVLNKETKLVDNPIHKVAHENRDKIIISGIDAYNRAINVIKGYEHYDKFGRLEIYLDANHYKVTFADVSAKIPGVRRPDYAYQIWINLLTKEVMKTLVGS